jgi:SAM-dependent methyltransferase
VRSLGFAVHQLMLHDLSETTSERFDAICSFQVLEHVSNPREFLDGMIGVLRPGGTIILSVPNAAVMRKIDPDNQDLLNQPPHHMGHWDEDALRALERLLPLKVRSVHREPLASYHIGWMVNGYLRGLLSPLGKTTSRLLVNRYSTLPLQWLMRAGMSRFFPGHTLLVEFQYQPK